MPSVLTQLPASTLSLVGNGFNARPNQSSWGYKSTGTQTLQPELSELHYQFKPTEPGYSVDGTPNTYIVDFNRLALGGSTRVKQPSLLDELDSNAPRNTQAGLGGVVSQVYKSPARFNYSRLGPQPGRY
jgi:hypothetical protein